MVTEENIRGVQLASALLRSAYMMSSSFTVHSIIESMNEKGIHRSDDEVEMWLDRLVDRGVLLRVNDFYSLL